MELYTTVRGSAEFTLTEKKSEFIAHCAPVKTEQEAVAFVDSIKKKYSDARHNVYAYVLREGFASRYSDDGEPHGTAGMPVLDAIRKAGVTDCTVVVTRYFGGILLGTGGLVRAYTAAAVGALEAAGIAKVGLFAIYGMSMNYSDYRRLMPLVQAYGAHIEESIFSDTVTLSAAIGAGSEKAFLTAVTDATNARVSPSRIGEKTGFIDQ
ncbi:MAG: YigZ family protein [Clostridia bacterium]|nr:YigZ family protein [Clostridia bacterium]